MKIPLLLVSTLGLAAFPLLPAQMGGAQATQPAQIKPLKKCPKGFTRHKDDLGVLWCMDASGRSYTPENARYTAKRAKRFRTPRSSAP